jgi:hypothetical protein
MKCSVLAASLLLSAAASAQIVLGPPAEHTTTGAMTDIAAGDVDEDGHVDLITMPRPVDPSLASILLGTGTGDFTLADSISFGSTGGHGELRDLNGDGHLDLLVAVPVFAGVAGAQWRLGAGDGTFGAPMGLWFDLGTDVYSDVVHALDLDGDSDLDYVVAQSGGPGEYPWLPIYGSVTVALDTGGGFTFETKSTGVGTHEVQAGDLDGDGALDLLGCNENSESLSVLMGVGGGAFEDALHVPFGGRAMDVLLDELNGDGKLDAIVADGTNYRLVTVKGQGDGTFKVLQLVPLGTGVVPRSVDRGDLDGDGVDDLVVSHMQGIAVVKGAADGTFSTITLVADMHAPSRAALADVDEDGDLDAAVSTWGVAEDFYVLRNETYPPGSPFTDLGHLQTPSIDITPIQIASGDVLPGTPVAFDVLLAPKNHTITLVLGFAQAYLPLKGLIMVPSPDVLLGPFVTDAQGHLSLGGIWPPGIPAGLEFATQYWMPVGLGPAKLLGSNAVAVTVP